MSLVRLENETARLRRELQGHEAQAATLRQTLHKLTERRRSLLALLADPSGSVLR